MLPQKYPDKSTAKSPQKYTAKSHAKTPPQRAEFFSLVGISGSEEDALAARFANFLAAGEAVVLPTETVYGLAADAESDAACERIFAAKKRPADNPLIVHCASAAAALQCMRADTQLQARCLEYAKVLLERFAPGPLTVIAYAGEKVCATARAGSDTVAVRVPAQQFFAKVARAFGKPIAAPSANVSGRPSATSGQAAFDELCEAVRAVADAGPCAIGLESTIVDCTLRRAEVPRIVRPGFVRAADIAKFLGLREVPQEDDSRHFSGASGDAAAGPQKNVERNAENSLENSAEKIRLTVTVPGSKYPHYKPRAAVYAAPRSKRQRVIRTARAQHGRVLYLQRSSFFGGLLRRIFALVLRGARKGNFGYAAKDDEKLSLPAWSVQAYPTWDALAADLYAQFLRAEARGFDAIVVDCPQAREHEALRNRLLRAAQ